MASDYPLLVLLDFEFLALDIPDLDARRRRYLSEALEALVGVPLVIGDEVGATDYTLLCSALVSFGLDSDFLRYDTFKAIEEDVTGKFYRDLPEDLQDSVTPGLTGLLIECADEKEALIAPLTGLMQGPAKILLERTGLASRLHLRLGGYCGPLRVRPDLVMMARPGGRG